MTKMDPDKVFGSDEIDLRGERVDPDLFRRVGENIVLRVRETGVPSPQVLLGGDTRDDTLTLMEFLSRGIFNRGGSIILIGGDVAKPVAYFAAQRYRADVVAYVTASHVRAICNGVKIHFLDKAPHQHPVLPLAAKEVVNKREEALNDYQQYLATRFGSDTGKGRPLVMDSLYSSSWTVAPHVFRRARFSLECIHTYIDRKFSCLQNNAPDPTLPRNLDELRTAAKSWEGVGVAFDGDMDRGVFVDENGEVVHADEIAMIIGSHILAKAKKRARVVYHCQCSNGVPETIAKAKGTPVIQETGWRSIKSKMGEVGAVFGSEISGHFFYGNDLYYVRNGDDALYTALMLFRALDQRRQTLAEARAELPAYFTSPELRVAYDGTRNAHILEALRRRFEGDDAFTLDLIGNDLRAEKHEGKKWHSWIVFRTSCTEPNKLSFRFEGRTLKDLAEIKQTLMDAIPERDEPLKGMLEQSYRASVGDPTAFYRRALEAAGKLP